MILAKQSVHVWSLLGDSDSTFEFKVTIELFLIRYTFKSKRIFIMEKICRILKFVNAKNKRKPNMHSKLFWVQT